MSYRKSRESSSVVFTQAGAGASASTVDGKLGETLSILDFGATGDGTTDDSTSIQNAIDALQEGDTLLFPDGLYLLGTGLTLSKSGVTLKGSNSVGSYSGDYGKGPLLMANIAALNVLTFTAFTGSYTYLSNTGFSQQASKTGLSPTNVTIDGLQFTRTPSQHTGKVIDAALASSLTVRNCTFIRMNLCVECPTDFGGLMGTVLIENNLFFKCSDGTSPALGIGRVPVLINGNTFRDTDGTSIGLGTGVVGPDSVVISNNSFGINASGDFATISSSGATSGGDWVISDNTFIGGPSDTSNIDIIGISNWAITGNVFRNAYVIDVSSTASDGLISGNFMRNISAVSADSIVCGGDRISILNNHIQNIRGTDLIKLEATSSFCTIGGNTFLNSPDALISIAIAVDDLGTNNELADLAVRGTLDVDGALTVTGDVVTAKNTADSSVTLIIDSGISVAQNTAIQFRDQGDNKFTFNKDSSNNFVITDEVNSHNVLAIVPNAGNADAIRIGSGSVGIGAAPSGSFKFEVTGTGRLSGALSADGGIDVNGDLVNTMAVTTVGATADITTEDLINCTTGGITLTLPAAATAGTGKVVYIKDRDSSAAGNNITIEGNGSETIDGSLTFVLTVDLQSVTLVSDGSNWQII